MLTFAFCGLNFIHFFAVDIMQMSSAILIYNPKLCRIVNVNKTLHSNNGKFSILKLTIMSFWNHTYTSYY